MFRIYDALTDEIQTAREIANRSFSYPARVSRLLRLLVRKGYAERTKIKTYRGDFTKAVYGYRRNGRDLIREEYHEWKSQLENVDNKFAGIDHSP